MTLLQFAKRMEKRAKNMAKRGNEINKAVSLEVVNVLTNNTPVDTSQAISNWQASLGSPNLVTRPPYVPGIKGSTKRQSALATIAAARPIIIGKNPGEDVYISNSLDYIVKLNEGSISRQPGAFVEKAIRAGVKMANEKKSYLGDI